MTRARRALTSRFVCQRRGFLAAACPGGFLALSHLGLLVLFRLDLLLNGSLLLLGHGLLLLGDGLLHLGLGLLHLGLGLLPSEVHPFPRLQNDLPVLLWCDFLQLKFLILPLLGMNDAATETVKVLGTFGSH